MKDTKDMQFINHIFSKHRIPAALIITSVLMLVVHFVSTSFASTAYDPADTLDPAQGPGDAFVQFTGSQWQDSGSDIYFDAGNVGIGTSSPSQLLNLEGNNAAIQLTATNSPLPGIARYRLKTTDGSSVDHIWDILNDQPSGNLVFNEFTGTGTSVQFNSLVETGGGLVIENRTSDPGSPATGQMWLRTDI